MMYVTHYIQTYVRIYLSFPKCIPIIVGKSSGSQYSFNTLFDAIDVASN